MPVYTTEITSESISSDNPLHQRLLKPYVIMQDKVEGDLLEIGCGEGRGVALLADKVDTYSAIDKIGEVIEKLRQEFPGHTFHQLSIPPFHGIPSDSYDTIVSFQVIEHIKDDLSFLEEINRVLKPGGKAWLTTPNRKFTLTRNPWHVREYLPKELEALASQIFREVRMRGIAGNQKVMEYHEMNRKSVRKITQFDVLNLQYRLPAALLKIPYEILNRMNRNRLETEDDSLVRAITHEDYLVTDNPEEALDLFLEVTA